MQGDNETPTRIEQYWEADSGDDESKPKGAFPIDEADDDATQNGQSIPTSAEEYIRSVRRQAAALPDVFSTATKSVPESNNTPRVIPLTISLAPTPDHLRPCETWVEQQLGAFRQLQNQLASRTQSNNNGNSNSTIPKDTDGWERLFSSSSLETEIDVNILGAADFNAVAAALRAFDESLPDDGGNAHTKWLYALLSRITPPLDGNTAATMRSILRKLTYARLNVPSADSTELGSLNLLISIISIHFKQG